MIALPTPRQQLVLSATLLVIAGFVLVSSASIYYADSELGTPFYYTIRHGIYALLALVACVFVAQFPTATWQRFMPLLVAGAVLGLVLVLVPGLGREVNGAQRWISLAGFNIQPSELAKIALLVFLADFIARRREQIADWRVFTRPLVVLAGFLGLLLLEPDFGTSMVMVATTGAVLFLAGVPLAWFGGLVALGAVAIATLVLTQPYRMARLTSFRDPWQHQFDSGYQLVQSLIAFGRGEVAGVGLGNSVQKLFYLPEAHTDFVFAVAGEEFGLFGVLVIVALFSLLVGAVLRIARERAQAGDEFGTFFCLGAAVLLGVQAFINMGVNMGLLPTKGLTLPLVSYGGSSLVANGVLLGMLWRFSAASAGATPRPARNLRPRREAVRA